MNWILMPVLAGPDMTENAIADCLAQSIPTRLLIINQGVDDQFRERLERIAEEYPDRVFLWSHEPPLPSLAATWNRALDFVWASGGEEALVINNDVRLDPRTYSILQAVLTWPKVGNLFVTAVGVTQEQFDARPDPLFDLNPLCDTPELPLAKGGPDFSCFLISRECHERYRFDEAFIPAFCEDLDYHRRLMLDGEGDKIFSVNLPYLHLSSQTLKTIDPQQRMKIERQIEQGSRAYYQKKWGGGVNQETFYEPFGNTPTVFISGRDEGRQARIEEWQRRCGPSTPELQRAAAGPPIHELATRMLGLTEVIRPQELVSTQIPDEDIPF